MTSRACKARNFAFEVFLLSDPILFCNVILDFFDFVPILFPPVDRAAVYFDFPAITLLCLRFRCQSFGKGSEKALLLIHRRRGTWYLRTIADGASGTHGLRTKEAVHKSVTTFQNHSYNGLI